MGGPLNFSGILWNLFDSPGRSPSLTLFIAAVLPLSLLFAGFYPHPIRHHHHQNILLVKCFVVVPMFRTLAQAQLNCSFNIQHFNVKAMKSNKGLNTQRKIKRKTENSISHSLTFSLSLSCMCVCVWACYFFFFILCAPFHSPSSKLTDDDVDRWIGESPHHEYNLTLAVVVRQGKTMAKSSQIETKRWQ